jgi:tripartite-type tricarboxylate transporter receptor subunit TctC
MRLFPRIVAWRFAAFASEAGAQTYPDRPIRVIVSVAAGSEGGR